MSGLAASMVWAGVVLLVVMVAGWLVGLLLRDVSVVDVIWGLGFVAVAWVVFAEGSGSPHRRALVAALVSVWGLRLAGHIGLRKLRSPGEDFRYRELRERKGDRFWLTSLANVFILQGVLVWVVSLPLQAAANGHAAISGLDIAGIALWATGLFFEAVGDWQLTKFKSDPSSRGRVLDHGLWRYTRHPNYFGDFCVWWGLYLIALSAGGWWSLPGPLVMSALLLRVSGKDHLERAMVNRKPGYVDYVARTSGFVPLPPRRLAPGVPKGA
jgi:steroid 5-alpha reductase family enzyme